MLFFRWKLPSFHRQSPMATLEPSSSFLSCNSGKEWFDLHFWTWEDPQRSSNLPSLVCVHGLTRNGRDFDALAKRALEKKDGEREYKKVVCPDVVGRGKSGWLKHHYESYGYPLYVSSISALLGHCLLSSQQKSLDYVGTSMGGLIGMMIAAAPNSPIRKLVLNDIGAEVPRESLVPICTYASKPPPQFDTEEEILEYLMNIHAPFGLSREEWQAMLPFGIRRDEETKKITLGYDPKITHAFGTPETVQTIGLWEVWKAIKCPVMVIRGEESELLTEEIIAKMKETNEMLVEVLQVPKLGHAPALNTELQTNAIMEFFAKEQ